MECDEIWTSGYAKEWNVPDAKAPPRGAGDAWTWTAIDAQSKLIVSHLLSSRRPRRGRNRVHCGLSGSTIREA